MTKTEAFFLLVGAAVCSALVCGIVAASFPADGPRQKIVAQRNVAGSAPDEAGSVAAAKCAPNGSDAFAPVADASSSAPASTVSDQSLLRLSGMVNIANSTNERPNKAQWQEALPVARQLLVCPCDCAQRNWLRHFVEMGNYALAGSEEKYRQSAQVIVTLGRNNDQAVAISKGAY